MNNLLTLISAMLRSIWDGLKKRKENDDSDLMADVDDQRAHHFGLPADLNECDNLSEDEINELC